MSLAYPTFAAGQRLTAAQLSSMQTQYVYKATLTDRTLTTTLSNDPDLQFTVVANGIYLIEFFLYYGGANTADLNTQWSVTATTTGLKGVCGPASVLTTQSNADQITGRFGVHGYTTGIRYAAVRNSSANLQQAVENSLVTVGSTGGTIALQWAQAVSSATATRMGAGSWGRCARVQ